MSVDDQVLVGWRHVPILLEDLFRQYSKEAEPKSVVPLGSQFPGVFFGTRIVFFICIDLLPVCFVRSL